ncbi:MAG: YidC/Oxa1 family membrane protein insertase [Oscillospiraceae bacterium]
MGIIGTPLGWVMYAIDSFIHNYGLSLIMFILFTKVVLFPLAIKQQKSTAKMASMSAKQKEIQKKYGKDKAKLNEAQMKLYEEEGVNPMAGCMPMAVQMILLFGIIDVIYKPLKHLIRVPAEMIKAATDLLGKAAGSLAEIKVISLIQGGSDKFNAIFTPDILSQINNFDMKFGPINLGDTPTVAFNILILIPILSGLTALGSTLVSMRIQKKNGQEMQGSMKYMMLMMPLMSVWIAFTMPAGAGVYWTVSNIFMIGQTLLVQWMWPPAKVALHNSKSSEKTKEKMRKKRIKMEEYNKMMQEKGLAPKAIPQKLVEPRTIDKEALQNEKEMTRVRLAEARKRMAEKYGETYTEE